MGFAKGNPVFECRAGKRWALRLTRTELPRAFGDPGLSVDIEKAADLAASCAGWLTGPAFLYRVRQHPSGATYLTVLSLRSIEQTKSAER